MTEEFENNMQLLVKGIHIDWERIGNDSYLRDIPALRDLEDLSFCKNITMFVGENGSGKSTLLEALAIDCGFNPEGGSRNYQFSTYDSHSELCDAMRVTRGVRRPKWGYFLRAESFYNVATAEDEYSKGPGGNPHHFHECSHGESFLKLVQQNFGEDGLYLLDEPEAALSPQRQLTLLLEIVRCAKRGAQFFIVTHSPILLGIPDVQILSFDDGPIHPIEYEKTESYQVTKMFLDNKEQFLRRLLDEE